MRKEETSIKVLREQDLPQRLGRLLRRGERLSDVIDRAIRPLERKREAQEKRRNGADHAHGDANA